MINSSRTTHALTRAATITAWPIWLTVCSAMLLLLALIALAPLLLARHETSSAAFIYRALGYVCHQVPERSFQLQGHPLPVCARCLGLYAGFLIGALTFPLIRPLSTKSALETPARRWFLLALVPTAIDFGLDLCGWWENTHASRALTGALLGAVSALYVMPGLIALFRQALKSFTPARSR
ncbi:MAG: DUF2085 domain-containing protein [Pyrinomonadaceae bacterium]